MCTPKENFLRLMRGDGPKWLGDPWKCFYHNPYAFRPLLFDAITISLGGPLPGQLGVKDAWGVTIDWPEGSPAAVPNVTPENRVVKDIRRWKEYVSFPAFDDAPWYASYGPLEKLDREKYLVMTPSFTGLFEFSRDMLGMDYAQECYRKEPEAMYALLSAYTDWKILAAKETIDRLHPDIIHSHDGWGGETSLLLPPGIWRDIIKPHYKRYYGYIKSRGVLVQHHAEGFCQDIAQDMVELGVDMWHGVTPKNDIPAILEATGGKLCLMGGIDVPLINAHAGDEDFIRAHVRECVEKYAGLGHFIPCATGTDPLREGVEETVSDELDRCGAEFFK